jgi:hypothetical protein
MDIEGSEYDVLPKMVADGTLCLVDLLAIEWHDFPSHSPAVRARVRSSVEAELARCNSEMLLIP